MVRPCIGIVEMMELVKGKLGRERESCERREKSLFLMEIGDGLSLKTNRDVASDVTTLANPPAPHCHPPYSTAILADAGRRRRRSYDDVPEARERELLVSTSPASLSLSLSLQRSWWMWISNSTHCRWFSNPARSILESTRSSPVCSSSC